MKKILRVAMALVAMAAVSFPAGATDVKDLLNKAKSALGGATSSTTESTTDTSSSSSSSSSSSLLSGLVGYVTGLVKGDLQYSELVGTWDYVAPAVTFQSDNLLKKAGGEVAAAKVESEMEPYYTRMGLNKLQMTFAEDSTFTMKVRMTYKGSVTINSDGLYEFDFTAFGKIKTGQMTAYMARSGNNIKMTFDVSKLISLFEKVSSFTGNSTLKTLSSLLSSYDGLNAGWELKKQEE
ncbi:MAG: DUF4923 family protein [Bacteroidales bacterium]|nr:DUF4923 family protein [Bacteroidales bacterium]